MQPDDIEQCSRSFYISLPRSVRPSEPAQQIVADIEDFACALSQKSTEAAQMFVDGVRLGFYGAHEWMRYWGHRLSKSRVRVDEVRLKYLRGDEAQVEVSYAIFGRFGRDEMWPRDWVVREESLKLRRREVLVPRFGGPRALRLWGIVWEEHAGWKEHGLGEEEWNRDPFSLRKAAFFLRQPLGILARIRADESLERLRSLSYAMGFLAESYGSFAFEPELLHEAIKSYVHSPRCFRVPGLKERYSFNTRLCGLSRHDISEPDRTIMFYEGQDEQPVFRYNDKAALCTVSTIMTPRSREEVAALKWEP